MADITYDNKATERRSSPGTVPGKGDASSLKVLLVSTIELAAATAADTIKFGRIPSNARISSASRVYVDDLATTGSPTLDLGLASVNANITSDAVALSNGLSLSSASNDNLAIALENSGLPAWDFVSGQASDPGGEFDVYGSILDANTTQTGTITVEIYGYLD